MHKNYNFFKISLYDSEFLIQNYKNLKKKVSVLSSFEDISKNFQVRLILFS